MRRADLIAGLSVAGLMLPEAVAYAGVAGLPPQRAIVAAIAGALVYALVGRSRFAIVSPTSSSAAILAAALATLAVDPAAKMMLATVAVAMTGLIFLVAGAARLGGLTGFISRPVLRGFAFGLAVTIVVRQVPVLTGAPIAAAGVLAQFGEVVASMPRWHGASVATGVAALILLLALRRVPMVPGAFVVLAAGVAASLALDLPGHGVRVVGAIPLIPGWPAWPSLSWAQASRLAQLVLPLVMILFAESWGTMRSLALRHGDTVAPDRELAALGLANLAAAAVQGMPVGAGFSAGSASEAAGATGRATGAVAAIGLALLMLFAAPLVAHLPEPVLAAVVIAALLHALDPAPFVRLWRLGRDQYVAGGAVVAVLALGVLNGMLVAIALSLAAMIRRIATPRVARLGRIGASHDFVDVADHPDAVPPPGIAICRPTEPLFFANAERTLAQIATGQGERAIVLSLEESSDIDSTALDALVEFDARMRARGIAVRLARVHDAVRRGLIAAGAADLAAQGSFSVDDAVAAIQSEGPRA